MTATRLSKTPIENQANHVLQAHRPDSVNQCLHFHSHYCAECQSDMCSIVSKRACVDDDLPNLSNDAAQKPAACHKACPAKSHHICSWADYQPKICFSQPLAALNKVYLHITMAPPCQRIGIQQSISAGFQLYLGNKRKRQKWAPNSEQSMIGYIGDENSENGISSASLPTSPENAEMPLSDVTVNTSKH